MNKTKQKQADLPYLFEGFTLRLGTECERVKISIFDVNSAVAKSLAIILDSDTKCKK